MGRWFVGNEGAESGSLDCCGASEVVGDRFEQRGIGWQRDAGDSGRGYLSAIAEAPLLVTDGCGGDVKNSQGDAGMGYKD